MAASTFIAAPFRRRTWAEFLYAVVGLPLCIFGFVLTIVGLSLGTGLTPIYIGLWVFAATGLIYRPDN